MSIRRKNEYRNPSDLKRHSHHVRIHPASKITLLAKCIRDIGITIPIIIDELGFVLAGWAIVLAALQNKVKKIPVVIVAGLSEARKRAYLLFDNKIAERSTYDWPALADELKDLAELLATEGLDFDLTGFNAAGFDTFAANFLDPSDEPDETPPPPGQKAVTRPGDIWIFNNRNRLLCDDCRNADYQRLMRGEIAAMCFNDMPFNISVSSIVGRGRTKHRNFAMAAGEMSPEEFTSFLAETLARATEHLSDGALSYIFMDWRHQREILNAGERVFGSDPIALVV